MLRLPTTDGTHADGTVPEGAVSAVFGGSRGLGFLLAQELLVRGHARARGLDVEAAGVPRIVRGLSVLGDRARRRTNEPPPPAS